jgi:hypothetical protein
MIATARRSAGPEAADFWQKTEIAAALLRQQVYGERVSPGRVVRAHLDVHAKDGG